MAQAEQRTKRKRIPCDVSEEFLEEIKDAVVFLQRGPEPCTTIRSFVEDAVRTKLAVVKHKHKAQLAEDGSIPSRNNVALRKGRRIT